MLLEFHREPRPGSALYVGVKEGEGEKWVAGQEGYEYFFAHYRLEEIDRLTQVEGFEGWLEQPTGKGTSVTTGSIGSRWQDNMRTKKRTF